jgi:hypothetical protein
MSDFRTFNVEAYNARLEALSKRPTKTHAKQARKAALGELPVLLESDVLVAVLEALELLRQQGKVGRFWRQNTGAHQIDGRYVRYGTPGCPDILGWLKNGRFMCIEIKRPGGELTPDQAAFLANAEKDGCFALVARSVDDVWKALDLEDA